MFMEEPVRQIVYFSTAIGQQDAFTIAEVLAVSQERNNRDMVTGLLVAGGQRYLQVIEGPTSVVDATMARIRRDHRHLGVTLLIRRRIEERSFSGWSMAYCDQLPPSDFATLAEMVDQFRATIKGRLLREQVDCFARRFVITPLPAAPSPFASPWTMASGYEPNLAFDSGHQ